MGRLSSLLHGGFNTFNRVSNALDAAKSSVHTRYLRHMLSSRVVMESLECRQLMSATIRHYDGSVTPSGFMTAVVAEGRIGQIGSATFEADIGASTSSPADTED